jgi:16S rRNA processing protein RimM
MTTSKSQKDSTGSSSLDGPVFVVIGKFRKPHGIRGEIRMSVLTDFDELIKPGMTIYAGDRYQPYTVRSTRWHGGDLLISLEELPDRTAVEIFRNIMVYMKADDVPDLPKGEYYLHQLVGMEVVTDQDIKLGIIKEILITGANDVYLIDTGTGKDILLPAIEQVVLDINNEEGIVLVHIIPGLLDI